MGELKFQNKIMLGLSREFGGDDKAIKWLERTLDCDYSSARRKLIGETKLSLEQLGLVIKRAPALLSHGLDGLVPANTLLVNYSSFRNLREVDIYLKTIIKRFEEAIKNRAELKYVARDLPLFYFLSNRRLAEFKFSLWTNQLPGDGLIQISDQTFALCMEVYRLYKQLDSIEVWNKHVLLNQFNMIEWYCEYQKIAPAYTNALYDAMHIRLEDYQKWAAEGRKDGQGNLDLLFTDFMTMNNGGMLESKRFKVVMTAISNVNFVSFNGGQPCENFKQEFDIHCAYATSVSRSNVLDRDRVFHQILNDLKGVRA